VSRRAQASAALVAVLVIAIIGVAVALRRNGRDADGRFGVGRDGAAGVAFVTLGPGSSLPSGAQCAGSVEGSGFEPRPENAAANGYVAVAGSDYSLSVWDGYLGMDPAADRLRQRVDGNFRGTTDEIIRWGACKWGFSEDVVRAVAVTESTWRQSTASDLVDGVPQSFGLLQVKRTAHPGSYPASQRSTAWNVDYALAYRRACYEGWIVWLRELGTGYAAGDEWGCVAHWYSGSWRDSGEAAYVADVQSHLADHTWSQAGF
jgi:autotransporter family porin